MNSNYHLKSHIFLGQKNTFSLRTLNQVSHFLKGLQSRRRPFGLQGNGKPHTEAKFRDLTGQYWLVVF